MNLETIYAKAREQDLERIYATASSEATPNPIVEKWAKNKWGEEKGGNFAKWFGNSKVVNEHGEPKVVYHGSSGKPFSKFKVENPRTRGFYFSEHRDIAESYAHEKERGGERVIPAYLKIENPPHGRLFQEIHTTEKENSDLDKHAKKHGWSMREEELEEESRRVEKIKKLGHRGIIFPDTDGESYIAFHPTHIKHVDNTGSWDPKNEDMFK